MKLSTKSTKLKPALHISWEQCFGSGYCQTLAKTMKKIVLKILFTRRKKKSISCYISDCVVNLVYMKKHCKTFNRENNIHRVKITSDLDPDP